MNITHENTEIGKDENGVYALIRFGPNWKDKVYLEEIFEDYVETDKTADISIGPHLKHKVRNAPPAFYDHLDPHERKRIKNKLNLRAYYPNINDDMNLFHYLSKIYKKYPPKLAFKAENPKEHRVWAKKLVNKVKELAHYNMGKVPLKVEKGPSTTYKNIEMTKYYIQTAEFLKVPAILAKPKDLEDLEEKKPGIICVHGHNKGKINTVGMEKSSSNSYYGIELALRGYVTLSLDQWGWGERRMQNLSKTESNFEKVITKSSLLFGYTSIGIRCWEVSRAIDFLQTKDFVNDKFGVIGQSGGGTTAAFSSVFDNRIDASVISGYFCTWYDSIFAMNHCICNFIPGIWQYADLPDIMATRAPKPTFIVSGDSDPIFPQKGVQNAYEKLKKAFELYGQEENLGIDVIKDTGHVFRGKYAYPWLDEHFYN